METGSLETMKRIVKEDDEYFEKFFPVIISVPEPDAPALCKTGVARLADAFASCNWFEKNAETEQFKNRIERCVECNSWAVLQDLESSWSAG